MTRLTEQINMISVLLRNGSSSLKRCLGSRFKIQKSLRFYYVANKKVIKNEFKKWVRK